MKQPLNQLNRQVWERFIAIAKPYWTSSSRKEARVFLGVILLLMLLVNGLNVGINYVGGDFMTALSGKNAPRFYQLLFVYGSVFVVGTPIVVFYSWVQDKLGLQWRQWLTTSILEKYFKNRSYYRVSFDGRIDNPDERIAQDVSAFTKGALSFFLVILSSAITLFSFAAILWSISTTLVLVLFVYAILGSVVTVWLGKRLIGLNFNQLKKEADFRFGLIHVRNNVESIAFYQGEEKEQKTVKERLQEAIKNFNLLIGWQRNLNFLTTGYNYFVVIIPSLVIAPLYFAGKVKFGVITQADLAFSQVLSALSIIVTQFAELTTFIAVINRLGIFVEALDEKEHAPGLLPPAQVIDAGKAMEAEQSQGKMISAEHNNKNIADNCSMATGQQGSLADNEHTLKDGRIATEFGDTVHLNLVTLVTPDRQLTLVKDLSIACEPGRGLLITGASGAGKSSLLRAIAGLWQAGDGSIIRPDLNKMLFLPQRPYMLLGTLRDQLLYPGNKGISDKDLLEILSRVNLGDLPGRCGGLDTESNWSQMLSLGEQQRLAFARIFVNSPAYAILDEATSALDEYNEANLYRLLTGSNITFVSVGHRRSLLPYHAHILELTGNAGWRLSRVTNEIEADSSSQSDMPVQSRWNSNSIAC